MTAGTFLNVDLEIESSTDLAPLAAEMDPQTSVLHSGPARDGYLMRIEIDSDPADQSGADERIHELCRVIEGLSPAGRQLWRSAERREFDVGYDATVEHVAARFALRTDTLERLTRLGATLAVTVYRTDATERVGKVG